MATRSRRRLPGDGSVYLRKDGLFAAAWKPPRAPKRIVRYAKTRREAQALLAEMKRRPRPHARQTVAEYLRAWLAETIAPTKPHSTLVNYTGHVERRIIPAIGHLPLGELAPADVQALWAALKQARYAGSTIRVCKAVLGAALQQAEDWELIDRNPARRTKVARVEKAEPEGLTPDQARRIAAAFAGTVMEGVVLCALVYGLRQSEILGLRWADVEGATVRVSGQLDRFSDAYLPRTKTGQRLTLPLKDPVARALAAQRLRQAEQRLRAGPKWIDSGFIFTRPNGRPLGQSAAGKRFRAGLKAAGLPAMRPHDLRHANISLHRALGTDEATTMKLVGHKTPDVHFLYRHSNDASQDAALDRLAGLFEEPATDAATDDAAEA